jgi:3-deoxy-D-manno-octulosonic acid kinase
LTKSEKLFLLVSPKYKGVTPSWFFSDFWGGRAESVSSGGRGSAWFVTAESASLVLRHYRRGGLMAKLVEKTYLFTGFNQARSIMEFRLLEKLILAELPVPEPVAAIAWGHLFFWYRAAIVVKRIPGAVNFVDSSLLGQEELWKKLGRVIRRFHDHGLDHVDLNCDNILVASNQIYLIDFDRCRLRDSSAGQAESWKSRNLTRLQRSLRKRSGYTASVLEQLWKIAINAYRSDS